MIDSLECARLTIERVSSKLVDRLLWIILALVSTASTALADDHSLPDHKLTPGATFEETTLNPICTPGYSNSVRHVTAETRREGSAECGLARNRTGDCDVDQGSDTNSLPCRSASEPFADL